jgi:hypothetical protein
VIKITLVAQKGKGKMKTQSSENSFIDSKYLSQSLGEALAGITKSFFLAPTQEGCPRGFGYFINCNYFLCLRTKENALFPILLVEAEVARFQDSNTV